VNTWPTTTIGEVCTTFSGGTPSTAHPEYYGGEIPWIASGDLNKRRIESVDGRITRLGLERSSAKLVQAGTPVIALYGATAGVAAMTQVAGAINQAILAMVPRKIDAEFLYQWLRANRGSIIDRYTQGGQPNLSGAIVRSIEVPLPPEHEQRRIAGALFDVDTLIATLERLIAKKQAIKQGMMQQLLTGMSRLPGFVSPWRQTEVGALLEFKNGLNKSSEFFGSGTPIVNFMDVMHGPIITAADLRGRVALTREEIKRFSAKRDDIFFTRTSETVDEVGTAAVLVDDVPDASFSGFILRGRPCSKDGDAQFLAYLFQIDSVRRQITSGATYTTRALTNGRSLSRVVVHIPSVDEQRVIAQTLTDVEDEIAALRSRLNKARAIKQGMMQQLLTGKTRLPVQEVAS
jgi:type I restriction enzyme, S subunit